ncbi:hypothetical protein J4G37_32460 [Microvirga sp. 3-52]|nr:hypothetical protein [Microvirga sp. 3-52]
MASIEGLEVSFADDVAKWPVKRGRILGDGLRRLLTFILNVDDLYRFQPSGTSGVLQGHMYAE